jgi:hypothetical protein
MRGIMSLLLNVSGLGLTLCLLNCPLHNSQMPPADDKDLATFHATFRKFLNTWLIKKDIPGAQTFFSPRMLRNPMIFDTVTMGGLNDEDRANPERVRMTLTALLKEGTLGLKAKNIDEIYVPPYLGTGLELGVSPLNRIDHDKYAIYDFEFPLLNKLREVPPPQAAREFFAKEAVSGRLFLVLTMVKDGGIIYWIWKLEGDSWKALHLDVVEI